MLQGYPKGKGNAAWIYTYTSARDAKAEWNVLLGEYRMLLAMELVQHQNRAAVAAEQPRPGLLKRIWEFISW